MKIYWFTLLALITTILSPALMAGDEDEKIPAQKAVGISEMQKALQMASAKLNAYLILRNHVGASEKYRLISVQNLLHKGSDIWWITFKPESLIPKDPKTQPIGLGGEIFITVDLKTNKTTLTHGE